MVLEARLDARHRLGDPREGDGHAPQLERFGPILGVIDRHQLAGGEGQPVVARLGLGLRMTVGHHHDVEVVGSIGGERETDRLGI